MPDITTTNGKIEIGILRADTTKIRAVTEVGAQKLGAIMTPAQALEAAKALERVANIMESKAQLDAAFTADQTPVE
jgi:hypothetical protein